MTETQNAPSAPIEPTYVQPPQLPYSFKATLKTYWKMFGIWRIFLAFAITLIFWFRFGPVVWIASVAGIALLVGILLFFLSSRRATLTNEGVEYRNALGRRQAARYEELEGVKVFVNYIEAGFGVTPRVSIAVKNGNPINFTGLYWPAEDLDKLLAVLNEKKVHSDYYADLVQYGAIAKQFPAYATYTERHTGFVAFISVMAILALAVGISLWVALS